MGLDVMLEMPGRLQAGQPCAKPQDPHNPNVGAGLVGAKLARDTRDSVSRRPHCIHRGQAVLPPGSLALSVGANVTPASASAP
ncbi:hypothetical protein EGM97_02140 [Pseudomonas sp. AF32]|nr:hypothetical protein [Pseudomonas sp. AF32]